MLLKNGDVLLASHRRMFQHDEARFFVGRIVAYDRDLVKLEGFSFVRDLSSGHVIRKDEMGVKLLSLASPGYIFYELSGVNDVSKVHVQDQAGNVMLMDGNRPLMNLAERSQCGHF